MKYIIFVIILVTPVISFAVDCDIYDDGSAYGAARAGICRKLGYVPADYDQRREDYDLMVINPQLYAQKKRMEAERKERNRQAAIEAQRESRERDMQDKLDRIDRQLRYGY